MYIYTCMIVTLRTGPEPRRRAPPGGADGPRPRSRRHAGRRK